MIKCPECGRDLKRVIVNDYSTFVWNSKTKEFVEDFLDSEREVKCPYCNADLWELVENGKIKLRVKL